MVMIQTPIDVNQLVRIRETGPFSSFLIDALSQFCDTKIIIRSLLSLGCFPTFYLFPRAYVLFTLSDPDGKPEDGGTKKEKIDAWSVCLPVGLSDKQTKWHIVGEKKYDYV